MRPPRRHISRDIPSVVMFTMLLPYVLIWFLFVSSTRGLCGNGIKWSRRVNIDDVYGVWYAVGYAQHTPDMTNMPNEIGCVTLFITDITNEYEDSWFDWTVQRRNYSSQYWRSSRSNPWSGSSLAGSWLDVRLKGRVKRSVKEDKRVRVLWDEDGHTMEQIYLYSPKVPGLWIADQLRPLERHMISNGLDIWYPDDPPRHPDVIRLLKLNQNTLILNHCSDIGISGIFTLILRRTPSSVKEWEWYQYKQNFYKFHLPNVYRFSAVCAACTEFSSLIFSFFCFINLCLLR